MVAFAISKAKRVVNLLGYGSGDFLAFDRTSCGLPFCFHSARDLAKRVRTRLARCVVGCIVRLALVLFEWFLVGQSPP